MEQTYDTTQDDELKGKWAPLPFTQSTASFSCNVCSYFPIFFKWKITRLYSCWLHCSVAFEMEGMHHLIKEVFHETLRQREGLELDGEECDILVECAPHAYTPIGTSL